MRVLWPAILLACASCADFASAGPFVAPGEHPNYDAQFNASEIRPFADLSILAQSFPQNTLVYQAPLIGYLSPVNPARLIVWTTMAGDEERYFALDSPSSPNAIPEPRTAIMLALGLTAISMIRSRKKPAAGLSRNRTEP